MLGNATSKRYFSLKWEGKLGIRQSVFNRNCIIIISRSKVQPLQTPELDKCQRQARKVTFLRWDVMLRRLLDVPVECPETTAFLGQSN